MALYTEAAETTMNVGVRWTALGGVPIMRLSSIMPSTSTWVPKNPMRFSLKGGPMAPNEFHTFECILEKDVGRGSLINKDSFHVIPSNSGNDDHGVHFL